ncbi:MAG: putative manganese-dependent inorganic diphosphatase [Firmicutes bacterium]|nr:putative manganese-dependent inorganic diphosphatase [Bacillota bacterium]
MKKNKITVIGHKNPDTDSICSAIAYAELKNKIDPENKYIARRAGQLNNETQFVLQRFGVKVPEYVSDIGTQVSDIKIRNVAGVSKMLSLKNAWEKMKDANAVTLPVTDGKNLEGLITIKDIVTSYMDVFDSQILARAKTPYQNLLETLEGSMVVGDPDGVISEGEIIIAAGSPDIIEEYIHPHDIVIVSDRFEAQLCAIEMGADCIIICNGSPVTKTIQKLASERNCTIISTKHSTYSAARLINQSAPVGHFMRREGLVTFREDDFTEDVKKVMTEKRHRDFPVLDRHGHYVGMISRRFLLNMRKKPVIMVDHNEMTQAVDGIANAEILEIIDHHRIASIETMAPVFFRNQPVGCTATIIYQMYLENDVELTPSIAGLLCAAILSDTLMFRSPTCTAVDKMAANALAQIAGIVPEEFAGEMFREGSDFHDKSEEDLFYQDFKTFVIKDVHFGAGQVNSMDAGELQALKERMVPYIQGASKERGLDMICFMMTNILEEKTDLLFEGAKAKKILSKAFPDGEFGDGSVILHGIVSRKKQLIPSVMAALEE